MHSGFLGASRNRTNVIINTHGKSFQSQSYSSDRDFLLKNSNEPPSPLQPIIQLANRIKIKINETTQKYQQLVQKQKECQRPTFMGFTDIQNEVYMLTASINNELNEIKQQISRLRLTNNEYPERNIIVTNIHDAMLERYNSLALDVKTAQRTFSKNVQPVSTQNFSDLISFETDEETQVQQERKNEDISELIRSAIEIRDLFVELGTMIGQQGSIVQRVDFNIAKSLENVERGNQEVLKARKHQKKSRMGLCAIILLILNVLIFLMVLMK